MSSPESRARLIRGEAMKPRHNYRISSRTIAMHCRPNEQPTHRVLDRRCSTLHVLPLRFRRVFFRQDRNLSRSGPGSSTIHVPHPSNDTALAELRCLLASFMKQLFTFSLALCLAPSLWLAKPKQLRRLRRHALNSGRITVAPSICCL